MLNARHIILTLTCFGLLSTGAMAMSPNDQSGQQTDHPAKASDARTQPPSGFGSNTSDMESQSQHQEMGMGSERQDTESITGEILRVQGELYTVKDGTGKEVKLHVDHSTQKAGTLKEGDKIEAQISTKRHAVSLKKADEEGKDQDSNRP